VLSFFSSRRNWDTPAGECAPPPVGGGRGPLAGERGVGGAPIPTKGHSGTLYICVLCGVTASPDVCQSADAQPTGSNEAPCMGSFSTVAYGRTCRIESNPPACSVHGLHVLKP
jgi:hypothetical protein